MYLSSRMANGGGGGGLLCKLGRQHVGSAVGTSWSPKGPYNQQHSQQTLNNMHLIIKTIIRETFINNCKVYKKIYKIIFSRYENVFWYLGKI